MSHVHLHSFSYSDVIENDIQLDDRLISVIREAQAGNTKRGAILGNNFRWPATTEGGKRVIKIPYKLESKQPFFIFRLYSVWFFDLIGDSILTSSFIFCFISIRFTGKNKN